MIEPKSKPVTLESLEEELRGYYGALAVLLEECHIPGSGSRMLPGDGSEGLLFVSRVNVRATRIGKMLPVWFKYGFQGVLSAGFSASSMDELDGPLERLGDMLGLLRRDDPYFELCLGGAGADTADSPHGHLDELVERVFARLSLDNGDDQSIPSLAALAAMNERSVRNAVSAQGEGRLTLTEGGMVSNAEARRWLKGRRGFVPTQIRELPAGLDVVPDALDDVEIPEFVQSRLEMLWRQSSDVFVAGAPSQWLVRASAHAGMTFERLDTLCQLPLDIRPHECEGLAKALKIDSVWFTHQVMTALYPAQVDMLLNPEAWRTLEPIAESEPQLGSVTVELTPSMLAHGYIDLPVSAKQLFPEDAVDGQSGGEHGGQVELIYGAHRTMTDIRTKSARTISPRRRFTSWLNAELGARPGDRIRLERVGERAFALTHIPG